MNLNDPLCGQTSAPAPKEPKRVKLSYHSIPVIWHDECIEHADDLESVSERVDGDNGMAILKNGYRIHVARNGAASPQEILLHEIMHIVARGAGLHRGVLLDRDSEEQVVTALAAGVTEVLVRNPRLAPYLASVAPVTAQGRAT